MGYAKPTAARLIDQRARRRACQALIESHPDEFHELYDQFRGEAEEEAERLAAVNATLHGAHADSPPRIKTGRRKPGQDTTERIDVARCPQCVGYHDRGHVCAKCGSVPQTVVAVEDDGELDEIAIDRAMRGEAVALTKRERDAAIARMSARGDSAKTIANTLGITDRTVERHRASAREEAS